MLLGAKIPKAIFPRLWAATLGQSENGKHGSIAPAVWIGNPVVAAPERQTSEQRDIY